MSHANNEGLISLARRRAEQRRAASEQRVTAERVAQVGDAVIELHDLIVDLDMLDGDEELQVYSRDVEGGGIVRRVSEPQLANWAHAVDRELLIRGRKEVAAYIRQQLAGPLAGSRAISFQEQVAAVAFADQPEILCFKRLSARTDDAFDVSIDELPGFAHVINLTNDPKSLALWIGSLLDWKSARTQYLHWYGGGGNGKSTVFAAIGEALGEARVIRARMEDVMSAHWGQELAGARLLLFPDANSTKGFSSGKFKELTGEESVTVNPKHQSHKKIPLTHKTAILSNRKIAITHDEADKRRLLPILSKPDTESDHGNKSWYKNVRENGEKILLYCYAEYERERAKNPGIRGFIEPDREAQAEAVEERYGDVLAQLDDIVIFCANDPLQPTVRMTDLYEKIRERTGRMPSTAEQLAIKEALASQGVEKVRTAKGRVFRPLKLKS